jgi:hypothetical protein
MTTEQAKSTLRNNGYFVDNLWTIFDVHTDTDEQEKMEILEHVFNDPYLMEEINILIKRRIEETGLTYNNENI